jgi:MFS family permease
VTARRFVDVTPRRTIAGGLALIGAGGLAQAFVGAGSSWLTLLPGLLVTGVGVGVCLPSLSAAAMASAPVDRGGMAAGALNTARQLGMALGIAALGTIFAGHVADRATAAAALGETMVVAGCVGLAGAVLVAVLYRRRVAAPQPVR